MSSQVERAIVPSCPQTVEGMLHTVFAGSRLVTSTRPSSKWRTVPCKCGEGLVRIEGDLFVCPDCLGSRVLIVGTTAYYNQQKGNK